MDIDKPCFHQKNLQKRLDNGHTGIENCSCGRLFTAKTVQHYAHKTAVTIRNKCGKCTAKDEEKNEKLQM